MMQPPGVRDLYHDDIDSPITATSTPESAAPSVISSFLPDKVFYR